MGVADRWKDWDEPPQQGGVRLSAPRLVGAVKMLMVINGAVFLLTWLGPRVFFSDHIGARNWIEDTVGLCPYAWTFPLFEAWQPLSYGFLHADLWHLLWNMVQLYFFGTMLEGILGARRFYVAYFGGLLCGAALHCAAYGLGGVESLPTMGASGAVLGVVVAAATLRPNQTVLLFFFPLSLKFLAIGLVIFDVYGVVEGGGGTAHWVHLGGAAFGFLGAWRGWIMRDPLAILAARKALKVEEQRRGDEELVDRLLEKISQEGLGSLSEKEKAALKRASQRTKV